MTDDVLHDIRRMTRDQTTPMIDEDIETLREDIEEVRQEVREDLAADFGGDPEDYRADKPIPDGGEYTAETATVPDEVEPDDPLFCAPKFSVDEPIDNNEIDAVLYGDIE